jgi:hypothetical protein
VSPPGAPLGADGTAAWRRLGFLSLDPNEQSGHQVGVAHHPPVQGVGFSDPFAAVFAPHWRICSVEQIRRSCAESWLGIA